MRNDLKIKQRIKFSSLCWEDINKFVGAINLKRSTINISSFAAEKINIIFNIKLNLKMELYLPRTQNRINSYQRISANVPISSYQSKDFISSN
jgi:hypothetical protein